MNEVIERPEMTIQTSPTISKFAVAFVKAQAEMGAAVKGKANPFFKSKYADLAEVIEVCKGPLNDNGIAFLQPVVNVASATQAWTVPQEVAEATGKLLDRLGTNGYDKKDFNEVILEAMASIFGSRPKPRIAVCTMLLHESGEWVSCVAGFPTVKEDPQAYFATTTYLRRASLQAILGIPAEDDDGNTAAGRAKKEEKSKALAAQTSFPPGEVLSGVFLGILPRDGTTPPMAHIQTLDGATTFEIYGDPEPYRSLIGREVEYQWEKKGPRCVLKEMYLKPTTTAVEVQAPVDKPAPAKPKPPIEEKDPRPAEHQRATVVGVKEKTGAKGPYAILTLEAKGQKVDVFYFGSAADVGLDALDQLEGNDIFFVTKTEEKKGKLYTSIHDVFPADVFESAMLEREAMEANA